MPAAEASRGFGSDGFWRRVVVAEKAGGGHRHHNAAQQQVVAVREEAMAGDQSPLFGWLVGGCGDNLTNLLTNCS